WEYPSPSETDRGRGRRLRAARPFAAASPADPAASGRRPCSISTVPAAGRGRFLCRTWSYSRWSQNRADALARLRPDAGSESVSGQVERLAQLGRRHHFHVNRRADIEESRARERPDHHGLEARVAHELIRDRDRALVVAGDRDRGGLAGAVSLTT